MKEIKTPQEAREKLGVEICKPKTLLELRSRGAKEIVDQLINEDNPDTIAMCLMPAKRQNRELVSVLEPVKEGEELEDRKLKDQVLGGIPTQERDLTNKFNTDNQIAY
jgi:hypothetical protein